MTPRALQALARIFQDNGPDTHGVEGEATSRPALHTYQPGAVGPAVAPGDQRSEAPGAEGTAAGGR